MSLEHSYSRLLKRPTSANEKGILLASTSITSLREAILMDNVVCYCADAQRAVNHPDVKVYRRHWDSRRNHSVVDACRCGAFFEFNRLTPLECNTGKQNNWQNVKHKSNQVGFGIGSRSSTHWWTDKVSNKTGQRLNDRLVVQRVKRILFDSDTKIYRQVVPGSCSLYRFSKVNAQKRALLWSH